MKPTTTIKQLTLVILWLVLISSCKNPNKNVQVESSDSLTKDVFTVVSAEQVGLNQVLIDSMEVAIETGEYPNIHSVLIAKDNQLLYEHYFKGKDEIWGTDLGEIGHGKDQLHDVRSISKTIVSLCVGILIKQRKLQSVNQEVSYFFPEYQEYFVGEKANLTVEHLLTMTSGLEWNEDVPYNDPKNSEIQMTSSSDPIEFILSRPLVSTPGKAWNYNGGTTQLLATIIQRTSGLPVDEYADKYLFDPLGVQTYEWIKFPEFNAPAAASGLRLTSRDLFKIGLLVSQKGQWHDKNIILQDYMGEAMRSHITFGRNNNVGYGYQFWILSANSVFKGENHSIVAAFGNGDQRIYFDSVHNLLVIFTAGNYNNWTIKKDSESVLSDFIYPSFLN